MFKGSAKTVVKNFSSMAVATWCVLFSLGFAGCNGGSDLTLGLSSGTSTQTTNPTTDSCTAIQGAGNAAWAQSIVAGSEVSVFNSIATDSSGNIYAAGEIDGTGLFSFGNNVTVSGSQSRNAVLVKYNSSGAAQWAESTTGGAGTSLFSGIVVDSSGNVYVAGQISDPVAYGFGNGVSASAPNSQNLLLVKYNSNGAAQWASTVASGSGTSFFNAISLDTSGNIYAAGEMYGNATPAALQLGNGVTATENAVTGYSKGLLVKYNANGNAQWAETQTSGSSSGSVFNSVAIDSSGNAYVAGNIPGAGTSGFGNGITATSSSTGENGLLVQYNSSGVAQWSQVTVSTVESNLNSVVVDTLGNVYVGGYINGSGSSSGPPSISFGNSISLTGGSDWSNSLLVKYSSSGLAQWAKTILQGESEFLTNGGSTFQSLAIDSSGNLYAAGMVYGVGAIFGSAVTGSNPFVGTEIPNVVLVKYDSTGTAQWVQNITSGGGQSNLYSVTLDSSGNIYAAGDIFKTGTYGFGNCVTAAGSFSLENNALLVRY
jgi:hypothetical protein